jgi:hypothetical protein
MDHADSRKDALVAAARAAGATIVEGAGALVFVLPLPSAAEPDELLPLRVAAEVAATSLRVLRDAIHADALPSFGKQRDRSVRRRDLEAWIESRRAPVAQVAEGQEQRVELRLARRSGR